jgi:diguanylate cyclase (GGDEF)-like protein
MTDRDVPVEDREFAGPQSQLSHDLEPGGALHLVRGEVDETRLAEGDAIIRLPSGDVRLGVLGLGDVALAEHVHVIIRPVAESEALANALSDAERLRVQLGIAHTAISEFLVERAVLTTEVTRLREENKQLLIDPKMGIPSEQALEERYKRLHESMRVDRGEASEDTADEGVERKKRPPLHLTFAYIDFDGFGDINTAVGHPTADRLLTILGGKLKGAVRPEDDVYRKGGDEAIILMAEVLDTEERQQEFRGRINAAGKEAFEEFIALLEAEGRHAQVENLRRIALVGYSVGLVTYDRTRHTSLARLERDADDDQFNQKLARKEAAGIDPAARSNVLPSDPMVGVLFSRHHED